MVAAILITLLNLMAVVILMVHPRPHLMVDMESRTLQNLTHLLHPPICLVSFYFIFFIKIEKEHFYKLKLRTYFKMVHSVL